MMIKRPAFIVFLIFSSVVLSLIQYLVNTTSGLLRLHFSTNIGYILSILFVIFLFLGIVYDAMNHNILDSINTIRLRFRYRSNNPDLQRLVQKLDIKRKNGKIICTVRMGIGHTSKLAKEEFKDIPNLLGQYYQLQFTKHSIEYTNDVLYEAKLK